MRAKYLEVSPSNKGITKQQSATGQWELSQTATCMYIYVPTCLRHGKKITLTFETEFWLLILSLKRASLIKEF